MHAWDFIAAHVIDPTHGEWYNLLARDGTVLSHDKVSLWKCPYHDGRTCLEMLDRLAAIQGHATPARVADTPGP